MGYESRPSFIATVLLFLFVQLSVADWQVYRVYGRQEPTSLSFIEQPSLINETPVAATPTNSNNVENGGLEVLPSATEIPKADPTPSSTLSLGPSAVTSAMNGILTSFPEEQPISTDLPISPRITPGFALAGIFMILGGLVYAITGIKSKLLHIYLSAAYLVSIGTTVLILFVMSLPVSNVVQAAYVITVFLTGAILGGASMLFTEVTEGLGCLLGGFCISMWLLVLQPGGIMTGAGKVILIAILTIAGFAISFVHYIKPYALIGLISFGGATSIILGIDCFSKAGLKEFWVYLWALNPKLFPLGTTSYPITRGMKVEIGFILIFTLVAIIYQLKLWTVIQERCRQKTAEKIQNNRDIEEEEENIGRRIEINIAHQRDQWEAVYGSNDKDSADSPERRDSGFADALSSRETPISSNLTSLASSIDPKIEMARKKPNVAAALVDAGFNGGALTVRVAQDTDEHGNPVESISRPGLYTKPNNSHIEEIVEPTKIDSGLKLVRPSPHESIRIYTETATETYSSAPAIVPLPFNIPDETKLPTDNRLSVGTFTTMGDDVNLPSQTRRSSQASSGSVLQRRTSTPSSISSRSRSILMIPSHVEDDRRSSLAATVDDLSDDEEIRSEIFSRTQNTSLAAEETPSLAASSASQTPELSELNMKKPDTSEDLETQSYTENNPRKLTSSKSSISSTEVKKTEDGETKRLSHQLETETTSSESVVESQLKGISPDSLPNQCSKVFVSYRTNEWAKHLDHAETPEVEDFTQPALSDETENEIIENPVPVNVIELQQTPIHTLPLPTGRDLLKRQSDLSGMSLLTSNELAALQFLQSGKTSPQHSQISSLNGKWSPQCQATSHRASMTPNQERGNIAPPQAYLRAMLDSSETLIGKRDSIIKNKILFKSPWGTSMTDLNAANLSQASGSEIGSFIAKDDDTENMPLSQRRNLIRQSVGVNSICWPGAAASASDLKTFDSHQPRRRSVIPNQQIRQHQMASWRASIQQDFHSALAPRERIEQQRSIMRMNRQEEEMRRLAEVRIKDVREEAWDEKMRSRGMLEAHREAMRRLQQNANREVV